MYMHNIIVDGCSWEGLFPCTEFMLMSHPQRERGRKRISEGEKREENFCAQLAYRSGLVGMGGLMYYLSHTCTLFLLMSL